jgi:aminopeptidase N
VNSAAGADRLRGWLDGVDVPPGLTIDASLRWLLVTQLARLGLLDEAAVDAEAKRDRTIMGAEQAAGARTARPTVEAKAEAWRLAVEEDSVPNETHKRICQQFWQRGQDDVLQPYVERYLRAAEDISASRGVWAHRGIALRKAVLGMLFPQPRDLAGFLEQLDAWLARTELADSVLRVISERRDDALRALRCQAVGTASA